MLPRFREYEVKKLRFSACSSQENTTFSPPIHRTWEAYFGPSLQHGVPNTTIQMLWTSFQPKTIELPLSANLSDSHCDAPLSDTDKAKIESWGQKHLAEERQTDLVDSARPNFPLETTLLFVGILKKPRVRIKSCHICPYPAGNERILM